MTKPDFTEGYLSAAKMDALLNRARAERAKAMQQALSGLPALFKRLAAVLRPDNQRLPQAGAWALRPRPSACECGNFA
jgi:hypothetical protein